MQAIKTEVFKVKIIKCSSNHFWYKNRIGEEFEVFKNKHKSFQVIYDNNFFECFLINEEDFEIIGNENISEYRTITDNFAMKSFHNIMKKLKNILVNLIIILNINTCLEM